MKTIGMIYTKLKDKIPPLAQSNIVYKLQCADCDKCYVGQSSQIMKNRIAGHKSDARNNPEKCMLASHVSEHHHNINYQEVKILEVESNYIKRSFLEMYHIVRTDNTMNKRTDTNDLSSIYTYIIELARQTPNSYDSLFEQAITF